MDREFTGAGKEKPGGGNAGSDSFCYRSLRFQVCGLAVDHYLKGDEHHIVVVFTAVLVFFFLFLLLLLIF